MKKKILQNKKRNIIYGIAAVWILGIAWSGNPPDGRTGAPGNGLCSDCHSQNPPAAFDGNLMVDFPADIMANQTYTLTVTANNPDGAAMRAGFQMTILDSNDDQAGTMANASGGSTVTSTGGRQYHEHNPAQNYGGGTSVSWTVDWTAPAGPDMENITWYAAGIVANGSGGNSGDLLVQSTGSRTLTGGGNPLSVGTTNIVDADCFGAATGSAEAEATGGMEPFTFNWSNGQTNAALMNVVAGTYIVSVTDNLGQMSTAEAVIDEPNELQIVSIVENVDCAGNMNGFIDVAMSAGGTGAYSYNWNTGATTNTLENLAGGTYILTLTDANAVN